MKGIVLSCVAMSLLACGCGKKASNSNDSQTKSAAYEKVSPDFNSDSAYVYVDKQVAFGPRVPNTDEHTACGDYLVSQLKHFGAEVTEQKADLKAYNGKVLHSRNIIGSYNTENPNRILLFAHWDTRPFSDQDPDESKHRTPLLGANDGASGVGVLLEVARAIQAKSPEVGVDIIFFDTEDYGKPEFEEGNLDIDSWCLGSTYWSQNPHIPNYKARYGILLDMVGAPDATFHKEEFSKYNAAGVLEKIWKTGRDLGYGRFFVDRDGGSVMDDHVPVSQNRGIPSVDIIQYDENTSHKFPWYWHTQRDNMDNINKETLKAVGQTVLEVVYKEKN